MRKTLKTVLLMLVLGTFIMQTQIGCSGKGAGSKGCDTLGIIADYQKKHPLYTPKISLIKNSFNLAKPKTFFPNSSPEDYCKYLIWADSAVTQYQRENYTQRAIMVDSHTPLESYFIDKTELDELFANCISNGVTPSGIRLIFGKSDTTRSSLIGAYTHFIFPTREINGKQENITKCGFIEQIKPCPGNGICPTATTLHENILEAIGTFCPTYLK